MQTAVFPLRHTWISQGMYGKVSHLEVPAIDFGWLSAYRDFTLYAPFDGTIVWADALSKGGAIALQSSEPVLWADGTEDFMTLITAHDNNRPTAGRTFKQGEIYSHMGTAGNVGKHCHLLVQRGKFQKYTGYTSQGYYKFPNARYPYHALWLTEDTFINEETSVAVYPWQRLAEVAPAVERDPERDQVAVKVSGLRVRLNASTEAPVLGFAELGGIYNCEAVTADPNYTWYRIADGQWIADEDGRWVDFMPQEETDKEKIERLEKENERLKSLYNDLLEEYDKLNKKLSETEALKDKYKKANARKIQIIRTAQEQTIEIGNSLNDLTKTLEV